MIGTGVDRLCFAKPRNMGIFRHNMKVFQIGFNKCGTRTLANFFEQNGLRCVHWDGGRLAKAMFENLKTGRSLIHGYNDFQVFTDMEYTPSDGSASLQGFKLYPELAAEFTDALFILNTRDREAWIQSRVNHRSGKPQAYLEKWKRIYHTADVNEVTARWREDWDQHHRAVEEFFSGKSYRLLVFNIELDSPTRVVQAMPEYKLDARKYVRRGVTRMRESAIRGAGRD